MLNRKCIKAILGPLPFLTYINDLHLAINNSEMHHFADNTNLMCKFCKQPSKLIALRTLIPLKRINL